jgi:hypothetical protein
MMERNVYDYQQAVALHDWLARALGIAVEPQREETKP